MEEYINHLKSGQIIAYPTETIWGLGADIYNDRAIEKIYEIKGRENTKAISVLVCDIYQAETLAELTPRVISLMEVFWPGGVTFVVPCKSVVSEKIHGGTHFVGLRQSSHPWIKNFLKKYKSPITTTSINKSGEPAALNRSELSWLGAEVLIVDDNTESKSSVGSTVVKIDGENLTLLRQGEVLFQQIESLWNEAENKK